MKTLKATKKSKKIGKNSEESVLTRNLKTNLDNLKHTFAYPSNIDFKFREVFISALSIESVVIYIDGTVAVDMIERHIIYPLINTKLEQRNSNNLDTILKQLISTTSGKKIVDYKEVVESLLSGNTVILVERSSEAIIVNTPGFESRDIAEPKSENILMGPKEAFVESQAKNRSLIRKQLRDENLVTEMMQVGKREIGIISLLYLKNITNQELVDNVKKRISEIDVDMVFNLNDLSQHLEERPYSLVASTLLTERPDRTVSFLRDGHVVILMDNAPFSLVVPVTFWSLFHTSDDTYHRWPFANFIRLIRIFAIFVALFTPSFYIAVSNYHAEMLPTDLLLAIAAARENVPFPAIAEVLLMELSFELLREAGLRVPTPIGPTIGIVGALILGQAAVEANIVSPIMVIIVAITGLASFAIPELSFNWTIRLGRFVFLLAASIMGFYGISLLVIVVIAYLASLKSFEVPFLSPMAPYYKSSNDLLFRPPLWKQYLRPFNLLPQDKQKGKKPEGSQNQ